MGMGMSVSPQIWQQYVDLVFQDDLIKCTQNFDVIMDDTFIHSTDEDHMDLFKVLQKYGLKISPHKCQFFKKNIVEHFVVWLTSYLHFYQTCNDYLQWQIQDFPWGGGHAPIGGGQ